MVNLSLSGIRMGRRTACIAITFLLLIAVSVWGMTRASNNPADATEEPQVREFVWSSDCGEGLAVTLQLPTQHSVRSPANIRIRLSCSARLGEYWQIREVNAYFWEDGRRHYVVEEGPFPLAEERAEDGRTLCSWTMRNLKDRDYEIDFCLQKKKDGMSPRAVKEILREQEAFTIRVDPLAEASTYVCARP